ncbi:metallophosphoesterase family protein [Actinomyces dentalis]|uniref:metallophosphoesterase family protein n=1 Tax=Actinomyces dentalis TaxID=272548 RepID=UPI002357CD86|nr:serine/threonine protein phosphatase [Actinomyces dentalis]
MNPVIALPRRWWDARSVAFRKITRTLVLLLLTGAVSLLVGLSTATASSPVGPHEAEWSTTLDSRLTLDLGPLGTISHASPAGPFGVDVVIGEIPGEFSSSQVDTDSLGQALSADGSSYLTLISRPELTVQSGVYSLVADGLRRAGLIESVILCLVAAGRLATGGRLRDTIRDGLSGTWASPLIGVTAVVTVIGLLVPALRSDTVPGTRLDVLAHTPLAQARLSGRVADVVQAYGDQIVGRLESNRAFYAQVDANLAAAWQASQEVGGVVDVTAASGAVDTAAVREQADAVAARTGAATASPPPSPGASPGATTSPGAPTGPGASSSAAPGASPGATPQESATPALPTGAQAVAEYGRTTAVLTTDLHCNLDMIALAGRLDALSGAQLHLDDGDLTMTGSSPEQVCVDALTDAIPSGVARVATIGNHDSEATANQLRARGWTVTNGTVQSAAGLRILGDVDADRSPAGGTYQRGSENSAQIGARLARTSCKAGADVDVVLIHQPYTFGPLVSEGCAPLLLAGHLHQEKGMSVSRGGNTTVTQLISGAGKGGTSIGPVTQDAYLHVLSFDENGALRGWRAVVVHPDASVTVGAWNGVPEPGSALVGASRDALEATTAPSDD